MKNKQTITTTKTLYLVVSPEGFSNNAFQFQEMSHKLFEGFRIEANALGQDVLEKMPKAVRNRAFPSTLKKLVVCDCMWPLLKKLYKGREMFKSLLMSINVCPCSC